MNTPAVIDFMSTRRSVLAAKLGTPGPDEAALQTILTIATRVPDHAKLTPWRILILRKDGQHRLADVYQASFMDQNPGASEALVKAAHDKLTCSPLVLAVIAQPRLDKLERIPLIEQQLSAGAVCSHILIAAGALGYGAQWLTGDPAYDPAVHAALSLGEHDAIAGFMHLGTPEEPPKERPRPELADVVREWPN